VARIYKIRDTQRFIFLALLFPLMPLLLVVIHPTWTSWLSAFAICFVLFTFWLLYRTRELEVAEERIRIGRGTFEQQLSHEEIYEIFLTRGNGIQFRYDGRTRYIRVMGPDYEPAIQALHQFAWRHAIPFTDRRPRPSTPVRNNRSQ
jgi:Ca2+/Na+ antiporter